MADWHPDQKAGWDEHRVVQAFCRWLEQQGWTTEIEVDHVDVVASRGEEILFAEVKGNTKARPGAGVDSMYGQLLRRMAAEERAEKGRSYAVVVPTRSIAAALRVRRRVRDLLGIAVYSVTDDGQVELVVEDAGSQTEDDLGKLRALCLRTADLAASFPDDTRSTDDVGTHMTRSWNAELTRAAGRMARTIVRMADMEMKEDWLIERALMELVANQAVLNADPSNALQFSMEEHNSNWRISKAMEKYSIGSPEERAAKARELEQVEATLRSNGLDPGALNQGDFKPFGLKVRERFETAGLVPHYEVLYLVASDYAHMNGRAVHSYLEDVEGTAAAMGAFAIAIELLIRSLRMADEKVDAGRESLIAALEEEYISTRSGADRRAPD
ncbi:MAG: DUF5677 domain-containing protein [Actinomycetota bacterium]